MSEKQNTLGFGMKRADAFKKQNLYTKFGFWKKFTRYFAVIASVAILLIIGQISLLEGTLFNGLDLARAQVNGLGAQFSGNGTNWTATIFNDAGSGFDPGSISAEFGAYHCTTAGTSACRPEDGAARLTLQTISLPVPAKGSSTQISLSNPGFGGCGRVQVDLGLPNGGGILGGTVFNTGVNCNQPASPAPSSNPTPTPGGQACTPGEWSGATCARCNASGTGMNPDGSDWGDFSSNASGWCGCAQKYSQSTQGKAYDSANFPQCFGAQPTPTPTPSATPVCVAPNSPQNLRIDGQPSGTTFPTDKRTFNLTWDGVAGATGYDVRLDDPRTPENPDIRQDNVQGTALQVQLRDPGVTYFWWIHAVNSCGGSSANNANFSIAGSGGPASPTPTPTSGSCDQFANSTVCGQRSYDICSPVCLSDGTAAYNCHASQNGNCQGTIMCTTENARCQASPTPTPASCAQYVNSTTCGQPSYDTCSPACSADGHAIYNCVASQRSDCRGTLFCDPENARCQASPTPTPSVSPSPSASCPLPMNPTNLLTNGQGDEASFPSNQGSFTLNWNGVLGADSYTVTIDDPNTSGNPDIVQNVFGTSLQVTISNPGRYTWTVKSNNSCGASGAGSIDFTILQPGASPTPTPSVSPTPTPSASGGGSSSTSSATGGQGGSVTLHITQQQTTPQPQVAGATAAITELPRTGLPIAAWAAAAFLPLGFKLRGFARGLNAHNLNNKAHYINRKRIFKK